MDGWVAGAAEEMKKKAKLDLNWVGTVALVKLGKIIIKVDMATFMEC